GVALLVGGGGLDIAAIPSEFLAGEAELKARVGREWVLVERDHRLGLDRQSGSWRPIIVAGVDIDGECLARTDPDVSGGGRHLEWGRDKILDAEPGSANRRRLGVEPQFDAPGAKPGVARQ